MDYRKNVNTPRDMIDDETLLRLMREAEPVTATFADGRRRGEDGKRGCDRNSRNNGRTRYDNRYSERGGEQNENGGCGCAERDGNGRRENSCESCVNDDRMRGFPLAMAYVPFQEWEDIYDDETALARGTLFRALDLPWYRSACGRGNEACGR